MCQSTNRHAWASLNQSTAALAQNPWFYRRAKEMMQPCLIHLHVKSLWLRVLSESKHLRTCAGLVGSVFARLPPQTLDQNPPIRDLPEVRAGSTCALFTHLFICLFTVSSPASLSLSLCPQSSASTLGPAAGSTSHRSVLSSGQRDDATLSDPPACHLFGCVLSV